MKDEADTLGRWMSHHLASRIAAAEEECDPVEQKRLDDECCKLILDLWQHRAVLPGSVKPLADMSEILTAVTDLRTNEHPYYGALRGSAEADGCGWLLFAKEIDREVRVIVRLAVFQAFAESVFPQDAQKAEKFRDFMSEEEIRILEALQRLVDDSSTQSTLWGAKCEVECDPRVRTQKVLEAIEYRLQFFVKSLEKLKKCFADYPRSDDQA